MERQVIITADDYGICEPVNEGIRLAADHGGISNISVLTNFEKSIDDLKELSDLYPQLGIGVHLNLNTGRPLSDPERIPTLVGRDGEFHSIEDFVMRLKGISREEIRTEIRAQVETLLSSGIRPDHVSSHFGIFSLYPPYFQMCNELAREYRVPVRSPIAASMKFPDAYRNSSTQRQARRLARKLLFRSPATAIYLRKQFYLEEMERKSAELDSLGIPHPDLMIDCFYGDPTPANLIRILENLPPGTSEIIVHLGKSSCREEHPNGPGTDYLRQRECELITLTSPYLSEYLSCLKIKKISYSELYK